jgi:hypothetical protein
VTIFSILCESGEMLEQYLRRILEVARRGDAREESFYPTLETMLTEFALSKNRKDISVTSQPKKTEAGNPDFRVWDGKQRIVGYIEAKTPDKNLDDIEKTEQVKRYKTTFPNFVLTNFFEFRLFRNGVIVDKVRIADPITIHSLKGTPRVENKEQFENLQEKFFSFSFPKITSAQPLAVELAKRTRFLRDEVIAEELREEDKNRTGKILGFYEAFQTYLIRGLTKEQFADLYSQTITYGLFASRMRCKGRFNRKLAVQDIPRSIGILREMFDFISLGDLPPQLEWIVDEIANVLANVDVKRIFSEYYRKQKGEDPIFHFYETFLAEYNPEERERRGVYYTPKPIVSYIARSLHLVLKEKFGLNDGLASENVTILDPAAGTLTFIAEAINEATNEFTSKYGQGGKERFINEHIMKNFYAFELMIAPYAIGHVKISFLLDELGHKLRDEEMNFYLTNTLELEDIEQTALPGMASLAEESRKAGAVKKEIPIWVILGNPPYSGMSANRGKWITELIKDYKYVDGKPLDEKNPKWLQDDYVKFIRFAEWKINQVEKGIVGYITNHSYLDNPTFRGMRQNLLKAFDEVYFLDLHGNSLKKEKCPDGSKDENVFDIRQGVAIAFFVKEKKDGSGNGDCRAFHSEVWGLREKKYEWLNTHDVKTTKWGKIEPNSPFYFFIPRKKKHEEMYKKHWRITDVFSANSVGVVTARDRLTIQYTPDMVWNVVQDFFSLPEEKARIKYDLGKDARDWKVSLAKQDLRATGLDRESVVPILYRPFDLRYTYYTGHSRGFICMPRPEIMYNMLKGENLALLVHKRKELPVPYSHFFVTDALSEHCCVSIKTTSYHFPLYVYENNQKRSNINPTLVKTLRETYGVKTETEDVLHYVYSVFYSNIYRNKYEEFLKTDFPRVPFTTAYRLFKKMAKLGKRLVGLHLLKAEELNEPTVRFQGTGDNVVKKCVFNEKQRRVYINKSQYFEGVSEEVWQYHIGSYQVLSKWLKYRRGKELSLKEIKHYCRVATALKRTIGIQEEIDGLYPAIEKDIIEFEEKKQNASLDEYKQGH